MLKDKLIKWLQDYLKEDTKVVLGISGGKDSSIMYALLKEAIGEDRIIAVTIPQDNKVDKVVYKIRDYYNMNLGTIDIGEAYDSLYRSCSEFTEVFVSSAFKSNTPARLRMTILYGIAALAGNARVVCTCNRSERYIGWETKFGDGVGDFAPFANLTVREIKQLGYELNVPEEFIEKKPDDGMCGKTDEEKFGFTYEELDSYLLTEGCPVSKEVVDKIEAMHKAAQHKLNPMPMFDEKTFDRTEQENELKRREKLKLENDIKVADKNRGTGTCFDDTMKIYITHSGMVSLFNHIYEETKDGERDIKWFWTADNLERYCSGKVWLYESAYSHIRALLKKEYKEWVKNKC